jgi:hypothetical protein
MAISPWLNTRIGWPSGVCCGSLPPQALIGVGLGCTSPRRRSRWLTAASPAKMLVKAAAISQ